MTSVISQNTAINGIPIAFEEPAARNAPDGLEAASAIARRGISNPTKNTIATTNMSGPMRTPITLTSERRP